MFKYERPDYQDEQTKIFSKPESFRDWQDLVKFYDQLQELIISYIGKIAENQAIVNSSSRLLNEELSQAEANLELARKKLRTCYEYLGNFEIEMQKRGLRPIRRPEIEK